MLLVNQEVSQILEGPRLVLGLPGGSVGKNPPANAGDAGLIPGSGEGNGSSFQYSGLGNPMDKGAWWAVVQGGCKNWARLSD